VSVLSHSPPETGEFQSCFCRPPDFLPPLRPISLACCTPPFCFYYQCQDLPHRRQLPFLILGPTLEVFFTPLSARAPGFNFLVGSPLSRLLFEDSWTLRFADWLAGSFMLGPKTLPGILRCFLNRSTRPLDPPLRHFFVLRLLSEAPSHSPQLRQLKTSSFFLLGAPQAKIFPWNYYAPRGSLVFFGFTRLNRYVDPPHFFCILLTHFVPPPVFRLPCASFRHPARIGDVLLPPIKL